MSSTQVKISVPGNHLMASLLGQRDELLRVIEDAYAGTEIHVRGNEIAVEGEHAEQVAKLFEELVVLAEGGHQLDTAVIARTIDMVRADERPSEVLTAEILRSARGRSVRPKTSGQKRYVDAIRDNVITFAIGPAGTGKSWLAVAMAVQALQAKQVERIILTRPAVEAGERLGFLPGDLMAKVDPYLRPLYDALYDMVEPEGAQKLLDRGLVEVAPLAFMRGRAQPVDRTVLTPSGWRAIGSLRPGDAVIGSDGAPTEVVGVFPQGRREVFRVAADDHAETLACAEHLWAVRTPSDRQRRRPWRIVPTNELVERLHASPRLRIELPVVAPVAFEERPVPLNAYALGVLLGDGCLTIHSTPSVTTDDPLLAEALASTMPDVEVLPDGEHQYVLRRRGVAPGSLDNPVTAALGGLALAGATEDRKFIPPAYLRNSIQVRTAVLQGLLDSAAGRLRQRRGVGVVELVTRSPRLAADVTVLVRSLGGVVHRRATAVSDGTGEEERLDLLLPEAIEPFRLASKRVALRELGTHPPRRHLASIEPAGEAETVCIQVAADDSLYVTDDFLVTHNTLNASFIILDEAQNTTPEQMKMFLTRIGFGSRAVVTADMTQVDLPTGRSGVAGLDRVLAGIDGLSFVHLDGRDVVRHRIVADIVDAYSRADAEKAGRPEGRS